MVFLNEPSPKEPSPSPLWKRLAWMVALWASSLAVLGVVAMIIRYWLNV